MDLSFHRFGHGKKHLLCFHGVGQNGVGCFHPFRKYLDDCYTIYAFDLPFHGEAVSQDLIGNEYISKNQWSAYLHRFLSDHQIKHFDIAGFSIGGRFALATIESFPGRIDKAFLMAPDGIVEHPVYFSVTRLTPLRYLYRKVMENPAALLRALNIAEKSGVFTPTFIHFVKGMVSTPERRATVFNAWVGFRKLTFDIPALFKTHVAGKIDLYLFMGETDSVLPVKSVKKLSTLLAPDHFVILPCGHSKIVELAARYLKTSVCSSAE